MMSVNVQPDPRTAELHVQRHERGDLPHTWSVVRLYSPETQGLALFIGPHTAELYRRLAQAILREADRVADAALIGEGTE